MDYIIAETEHDMANHNQNIFIFGFQIVIYTHIIIYIYIYKKKNYYLILKPFSFKICFKLSYN